MAELRVDDILDIISYTIIELRRLFKNKDHFGYHLKCSFIEILIQYMFAVYAKTRIKDGSNQKTIKVVGRNIVSMYNEDKRRDLGAFIIGICELRNEIAHARQLPKTIQSVDEFWEDPIFDELLDILKISTDVNNTSGNTAKNPFDIMAGR